MYIFTGSTAPVNTIITTTVAQVTVEADTTVPILETLFPPFSEGVCNRDVHSFFITCSNYTHALAGIVAYTRQVTVGADTTLPILETPFSPLVCNRY